MFSSLYTYIQRQLVHTRQLRTDELPDNRRTVPVYDRDRSGRYDRSYPVPAQRRSGPAWEDRIIRAPGQI